MKNKKIPGFFSFRIYLTSLLLFLMLVFPISLIMLFKYGPYWLEEKGFAQNNQQVRSSSQDSTVSDQTLSLKDSLNFQQPVQNTSQFVATPNQQEIRFGNAVSLLFRMLAVSLLLGFAFNYPFQRFFKNKRRGKDPGEKLSRFCRKWLLKVPLINSAILALSFSIALVFMGIEVFSSDIESIASKQFYRQFFFIAMFASFLSVFFMFFWFRFRVRFKYLEHVYDSVSLYKNPINTSGNHLVHHLWINSIMTTLLPLSIVIFYLSLSVSSIQTSIENNPSTEQAEVLFGKYLHIIDNTDSLFSSKLFYVNAIDSLLMFVGIFSGILISVIYLFFFVNWTNQSIIIPIEEMLQKMRDRDKTELEQLAVVRTTDEMGKLAVGYNEMAGRISANIRELKQTTAASQRFVPKQFLQMLGKHHITEVMIGDQIQKEMTVLFVDIKSFTALSEKLSPKENFDFMNAYLKHMEPVIHKNQGFIDKFIGDSIMALFDKKPEHALNAALEMQECLQEFNTELSKIGMKPIATGTGIHTGSLMLGMVGGEGRMEGTVISDAVNLASRIEGLTRDFDQKIIISETTLKKLQNPDKYSFNYLDEVRVKGRVNPVKIYGLENLLT